MFGDDVNFNHILSRQIYVSKLRIRALCEIDKRSDWRRLSAFGHMLRKNCEREKRAAVCENKVIIKLVKSHVASPIQQCATDENHQFQLELT